MNIENEFVYSFTQYSVIGHVFTLGYAAMAAGFAYFILTSKNAAPRYQLSSTLSAVVMASAFLELLVISNRWTSGFDWNGENYVPSDQAFSNGYRYMNWSIDVPVLLTQLLIVLGVTGVAFRKAWILFVIGGLGMIYTGYLGQFDEVERGTAFWVWGIISTVFFLGLLVLVARTVFRNRPRLPEEVHSMVGVVWWLLLCSWTLYPIAYVMPALWDTADGVVLRQILYTLADISSKIIYGILLAVIARKISRTEGYDDAVPAEVGMPRGGVTDRDAPGRI